MNISTEMNAKDCLLLHRARTLPENPSITYSLCHLYVVDVWESFFASLNLGFSHD